MGKFHFIETPLSGIMLVETQRFGDARGYFSELYNAREFGEAGINAQFVQDNLSRSARGVLRGMHYQIHNPQGKLVRVVSGEVFDVGVDLRVDSPTLGQWYGTVLSAENGRQMYIAEGFAHGFLVLSETAEFAYKCTRFYDPDDEGAFAWNDKDVGIRWPAVEGMQLLLSEKDKTNPPFAARKR